MVSEAIEHKQKNVIADVDAGIEKNFLDEVASFSEDYSLSSVYGAYREIDGRYQKIESLVDACVRATKNGDVKPGHIMYMKKGHAEKVLREARRLIEFQETLGTSESEVYLLKRDDAQAYLNMRSIGEGGAQLQDTTIANIKNLITKINKLECIATGETFNYSSNIKTRYEMELNGATVPPAKTHSTSIEKTFKQDEFQKIYDDIVARLKQDPNKVYDPEVAFVITGIFGLRPSTTMKLTTADLDVKKGWIEVDASINKSEQTFIAKSGMYPSNESIELLGLVYKRALLRNSNSLTEDGNVPLLTCVDRNLFKGFTDILRKHNIATEYGNEKYRALRRMYAQNIYDDCKEEMKAMFPDLADRCEYDAKANAQLIAKTIAEVNYLMGHTNKHKNTTIGYISNIH